uniref:Autophagy-related protein 2 n=1 Tax=Globodera rostochiensis TaxID=31243 RepID=A0A914GZH6_GLORO
MGQYLMTKLTSDQLELHLADGTASVQGVMLNSEFINETLEASGVRMLSLKDGYVEELTVGVPWKRLLLDSTIVKIRGLQLTLTPLEEINMANTQDLMTSFVGSIASSMELAKSVIVDEQLANGANNMGIEQCASLIDQIIARIKVQFENVTIRLEAYSELCTGVEIQIDRMEFLDEQLEEQLRNASTNAITEQPDGLYTVTDLNKLLHVHGVRLYTDIWSPIRENRMCTSRTSDATESDGAADMAGSSMNYQSCYSHFSSRSNSNTFTLQKSQDTIPPNPTLFAQLFDEKHTLRIRVKNNSALSYAENAFYNKRVDVDLFFRGPMFLLLTPSQIELLKNLFSLLAPKVGGNNAKGADGFAPSAGGGVPMGPQQYAKLIEQMQQGVHAEKQATFGLSPGSWSGSDRFYDLTELFEVGNKQRKGGAGGHCVHEQHPGRIMEGVELDPNQAVQSERYRSNSLDSQKGMGHSNRQSSASIATLVERRPDIFSISVRAPALVAVITHDDPLSAEAFETEAHDGGASPLAVASVVQAMNERAEKFFAAAQRIKIAKRRLEEQREQFAELYDGDCLRLVANDFFTSLVFTTDSQKISFEAKGHLKECDFIECLQQNEEPALFVDILNIAGPDDRRNALKNDIFTFQITNTQEKQNDFKINVSMEQCKSDVDFSLIDRISNLLAVQPFFSKNKAPGAPVPLSESVIVGGLKDNFEMEQAPAVPTFHVKCYCNRWLMNLRVPIADFLSDGLHEYRNRNLHPEHLQLVMENVNLELPKFSSADLSLFWTLNLESKTAKGTFVGDPDVLQCSKEAMTFFFADAPNAEKAFGNKGMKLELRYDARNKALSSALQNNVDALPARSMYESFYRPSEDDKMEGPFSKKNDYFTYTCASNSALDQKIIMAGRRHEMLEFAKECQQRTNFAIELSVSQLNIAFPGPKFYEVLYNRFAFDLALWKPKSPRFFKTTTGAAQQNHKKQFTECFSTFLPFNGNEGPSDEQIDECSAAYQSHENSKLTAGDSHLLTVGVHVAKTQLLLQTIVDGVQTTLPAEQQDNIDSSLAFTSQLLASLVQSEFFLVYGFGEDPNLAYVFLTSKKAELFHKNLLGKAKPFCADVSDSQLFTLAKQSDTVCFEEVPSDQKFERVDDDNFAIALKMQFYPEPENTKDIFVAFGLRNSLVHLRPFSNSRYFWVSQFANFFTVSDYGVPGYVLPKVEANLHIHLESVFVGYDHSSITPSSPFQLRFEIGLAYLTSNIVKDIERLKFDCHFQDLLMWMRKKPANHLHFDHPETNLGPSGFNSFNHNVPSTVKVFHCDAIHFIVAFTIAVSEVPGPLFDFECVNNSLTVWLCADTVIEFLNILTELYQSDTVKKLLSNDVQTEQAQQERLFKLIESCERNANVTSNKRSESGATISLEEEERLIKMMEAAMSDLSATIPSTSLRKGGGRRVHAKSLFEIDEEFSSAAAAATSSINGSPSSVTTENTDDEFILIDAPSKPSSSGVTQIGDRRFQTRFGMGGDFEFVTVPIGVGSGNNGTVPISKTVDDLTTNLPPLFRFEIALSLDVFLFGGTDFGDSARTMAQKTYSKWNYNNLDRRMSEDICSQGGKYRDHTVIVQFQVSKLSFVSKVFDKSSPVLSYNKLKVAEFKVFDHLSISHINEMIHRLEGPRNAIPFFSGYLIEDPLREAILRISLVPVRLNIDQDTIEFLMDFKNELVQSLRATFDLPLNPSEGDSDDVPLMEVSKEAKPEGIYPKIPKAQSDDLTVSFKVLKTRHELLVADESNNLDELFSEDDVNFSDSFCAKFNLGSGAQQPSQSIVPPECAELNGILLEKTENGSDQSEHDETTSSTTIKRETIAMTTTGGLAAKDTFIKDFSFSPACLLRIDYEAKRVKTDQQGALIGFLIGMANLNKTELTLKELRVEKGFLGIERCAQFVINEWVRDIMTKQFPNVVGSLAPLNALVQLAQGFHDLFALPYDELCKENGQLIRGIQRGTSSFGLNAATAAIDATQRVVGLVQNVAELAFDIVNPDFAFQRQRRILSGPQRVQIAGCLREGFSLAYSTVREGVMDTAQTLQAAAAEDRALGGWGMGVLRHMTPSAIKPFVIASKATSQVLGGLKNQLKPEDYREELRKWRQINGNMRRQGSSGTMPPSSASSTGSFQQRPSSSSYEQPPRANW